jgi:GNAT superfamily N-acetyltransferase
MAATEPERLAELTVPPARTRLRCAAATDRQALQAFLRRLSPTTVKSRYLSSWASESAALSEAERLLEHDQRRHVVVLAVQGSAIRGVGEFVLESGAACHAELGLVVEDAVQRRGIGQRLYRRLERLARLRGVSAFTGDIHYGNQPALRLLRGSGRPTKVEFGFGVIRFTMQLDEPPVTLAPIAGAANPRPAKPTSNTGSLTIRS